MGLTYGHQQNYQKKKIEIYRAVAVTVFSIIKFSPKGLTTKNDGFLSLNFWPFPGFFYNITKKGFLLVSIIHVAPVFWIIPAKFP